MTAAQKWQTKDSEDRGHYRKVSTRKWNDAWLRAKSIDAERVWDYLTTHPNSTSLPGILACEDVAAAKRLRMRLEQFHAAFDELRPKAEADWEAGLVWLPTGFRQDPPSCPNVVAHWRKLVRELPECPLLTRALLGIREGLAELFLDPSSFLTAFDTQFANLPFPKPVEPFQEPFPEGFGDPGGRIQDPELLSSAAEEIPNVGSRPEPKARPPPPKKVQDATTGPSSVQEALEQDPELQGLWWALEVASAAALKTVPRRLPPSKVIRKLQAFWESHQRDTAWALDTQARWINRDRRWVANLNPPGATEVLLDDGQWPRFRRARPGPEPVAEESHFAPAEPEPEVWGRVLALLREDGKNYALSWLDRIRATETSDAVVLHSPDRYFATWVSEHYAEMIRATLRELSETRELEIRSPEAVPPPLEDRPTQARAAA